MTTKLTLKVQKSTIEKAKNYAKNTGRSLSEIVEKYLENIVENREELPVSSKLKKIIGAVNLPKDFDEKKELNSYYEQKHL